MLILLTTLSSLALAAPLPVAEASALGSYTNVVPDVTLFVDYVEICFNATFGATQTDVHVGGGSTVAGNCVPGTPGYVLELIPRPGEKWVNARATCLAQGMRLPELFELLHACENPFKLGFASQKDPSGWASNSFSVVNTLDFQVHTIRVLPPGDCRTEDIDMGDLNEFVCAL